MSKRISIITGATGDIGYEFVRLMQYETVDEIWVIGRNNNRLNELKQQMGEKIVPICKDLTNMQDLASINYILEEQKPTIAYLINNAGIAKMMLSKDFETTEIERTIGLNCMAPVVLINYCIPFMMKGSKILNLSSASAFQPVPYINLYAATKAFERSYSRALNVELKQMGITVTAVCPSWVDTKMLTKEMNGKKVKFHGLVNAERVAQKALKDAKKDKDMSICSLYVKCQHFNVKLMPQKLIMKIWMHEIKKYL